MSPLSNDSEGFPKTNGHEGIPSRLFPIQSLSPSLKEFDELCSSQTINYSHAVSVTSNIPIYDISTLSSTDEALTHALQDEWHHILHKGPGVFVIKHFFSPNSPSTSSLFSSITQTYNNIIASEQSATSTNGDSDKVDQFAFGDTSRIWNFFQKHAVSSPSTFISYYSNPWLTLAAEAWLGSGYHITSVINNVRPGGAAQVPHRDYHMGFNTLDSCATYPLATQIASQFLTLQGAVAHTDMPADSGPTRFLPFSQQFAQGYMAYHLPEFTAYFEKNFVALPMKRGDAVFFNPAILHGAGANHTADFDRTANLLQISSPFGKPMESVDHAVVIEKCWDELKRKSDSVGGETVGGRQEVEACIKAMGAGYPFPTNLDRRMPKNGNKPESEQDVLRRGLREGWSQERVVQAVQGLNVDSQA